MPNLSTFYPANLIASNPIQLSMNLDLWDPRLRRSLSRAREATAHARGGVVELIGFEPTTSALQGRRSPN
jgi:hypothetical protein